MDRAHEVELVGGPADGETMAVPECYLGMIIKAAIVQSLNSPLLDQPPVIELNWQVDVQVDETHWRAHWIKLSAPPAGR